MTPPRGNGDRPTLLLAEDDQGVSTLLRMLLDAEGYQVIAVPTGRDVVALIRGYAPDGVLLDLMMPERDGVQTLSAIKGLARRPPVLVISAKLEQAEGTAYVAPWGAAFLAKPFSIEALSAAVATLVAREGP